MWQFHGNGQNYLILVIKLTYSSSDVDRTPSMLYIWCAFSYVGAMLASNAALQYVSYPTQVTIYFVLHFL